MTRLRIAIALLILGLTQLVLADQALLSVSDYQSTLDHYLSELQKVRASPGYAVNFNQAAPSSLRVHTAAGEVDVPLEFLHKELAKYLTVPPDHKAIVLSQLESRLKTLREESSRFELAHSGDPVLRRKLDQILAAYEFRRVHGPNQLELLKDLLNAWLEKQLKKMFPNPPDLDQLGQICVWIMIAVACSILAVWLYRRSRERMLDRQREVLSFSPSARNWRSWLSESKAKAAAGEWREAIHLGFWASVSRLESDGVWKPDKARTPREYLNEIPRENGVRSPFAAVVKMFEVAWYGERPSSSSEFQLFLSELEKLGCRG